MRTGIGDAVLFTMAMGAAIFFCRAFPFLFFRGKGSGDSLERHNGRGAPLLAFVEKTVPPVAMTVLAFNSLAGPVKANLGELVPVLAAAAFTAGIHLWKRNPMISIFAGTALYMALMRILGA